MLNTFQMRMTFDVTVQQHLYDCAKQQSNEIGF